MSRLLLINLFVQIIFITPSCSQVKEEKQLQCFREEVEKLRSTFDYLNVMKSFSDTLNSWLVKDIKAVRYLNREKWSISDAVFFNKDKSKCLLLLASIDPDTSITFDGVKIIGGEKINMIWHFYFQSYPMCLYNRKENEQKRPFTFEEMTNDVISDLIRDGYFKKNSCEINYNYIDSDIWFADWMRKKHQEFLESKW